MSYTLPVLPENQWCSDIWHDEIAKIMDAEQDGFAKHHAIDKVLAGHLIREGYEQVFLSAVWPAGNA